MRKISVVVEVPEFCNFDCLAFNRYPVIRCRIFKKILDEDNWYVYPCPECLAATVKEGEREEGKRGR